MATDLPSLCEIPMREPKPDYFENPFNITKAVDFSDQQIIDTWVDLPGGESLLSITKPTSPMPMFLLGGKGSGRTHLMRYLSYPVQKLRSVSSGLDAVRREGFIGIYLRCGGLNAGRFSGKRQDHETWNAIFAYYMDLWLAQITLGTMVEALAGDQAFVETEVESGLKILGLFADVDHEGPDVQNPTLKNIASALHRLQRTVDSAVNNAALTRRLDVKVLATRVDLVFGIPRILAQHVPVIANTTVVYLVDEFENLGQEQQKYVNTLIREREPPSTLKIGARLYGVRTRATYSAQEENREGSEYEAVYLGQTYLTRPAHYDRFARRLVARRLIHSGMSDREAPSLDAFGRHLDHFFEDSHRENFMRAETYYVQQKYRGQERPYFRKLVEQLERYRPEIDRVSVIQLIQVPDYPLLEKLNVLIFYQDWHAGRELLASAQWIRDASNALVLRDESTRRYQLAWNHFQDDLFAQLLRETGQKQRYLGVGSFISMSSGLPRNLLVILKHVHKWATFNGERPFGGNAISRESQQLGVLEASSWFFEDARVVGELGGDVQAAVGRLAEFFRALRFADKPVESSLGTFSTDMSAVSERAARTITTAEQWSLIIKVPGGQRDRNSRRIDQKYQLNPMLCPRWDLPLSRRGAVPLPAREVNAIFDNDASAAFGEVLAERLSRMNAPFAGSGRPGGSPRVAHQPELL
jgi:hypothetical protein